MTLADTYHDSLERRNVMLLAENERLKERQAAVALYLRRAVAEIGSLGVDRDRCWLYVMNEILWPAIDKLEGQ